MIWERKFPERVILSFLFLIKLLNSVLQHGHYRYSRDVPSACFRHPPGSSEKCLRSSHLHRLPVPDFGPPSSPLREVKADSAAAPWYTGFFKRLQRLRAGPGCLNPPGIYQLPRKLRVFKVSSLHLAAYVGTGGRWTLWKCLPRETGLQTFCITADGVSVDFYMLNKSGPDIIHHNDSLYSSLRLLCKDTLRRLNSSELLLLLLIAVLHIRV